ncbi:CD5 protein, partial [Glareola pratincola]|nr:CD5 protein [Glareola pratincola]
LQLHGGGCRCAGMLEVRWRGRWNRVCRDSLGQSGRDDVCRRLGCGPVTVAEPLRFLLPGGKEPPAASLRCQRPVATLATCRWAPANCTEHVVLACSEPVKTTPEPPPAPPSTTPEPIGPSRLQLVDGDSGCSGFLELHREGLWGAVAESPGVSLELAARLCHALRCGTAIDGRGQAQPEPRSHLPVRWEATEPCENRPLFDCFNRTRARWGRTPAFVTCSGSAPRALRRLAGGPTPCEGDAEVFHEGQWRVLCDNRAQRSQWGQQLCRELRCGNLSSSAELRDPPATGVTCGAAGISHRPGARVSPGDTPSCHPGQDSKPRPAGTSASTVVSICLALLLFGVLLLICGPPAYRRLMKR